MALLKCSICGLQKEVGTGSNLCPMCGGEFLPEEEKTLAATQEVEAEVAEEAWEFFHPELVKSRLYQIALPAFKEENRIEDVLIDIEKQLKSITKNYPNEVFTFVWEGFSKKVGYVIKDRNSWQQARAMAALNAATELADAVSGRSIKASPGLGFSLITNNAVDAATYIGLAAVNAKMDRARQEVQAVKKANQQLRNIPTGETGASSKLADEIDLLVYNLAALHNAYTFVEEHKDFYKDASQYDAGISFEGVNLYTLLVHATKSSSGFIGDYTRLKLSASEHDLKWILPQLEGAGYIKYLDSYSGSVYYVTTGKYESAILRQKYWDKHPEEKIAEENRIRESNAKAYAQAETYLSSGKYYDAAITFGKLDGYKDSMARSLEIWKTKLLSNFDNKISVGHYALTADGRVLLSNVDESNKMRNDWVTLNNIKQIVELGRGQFIALGYNGRLKSNIGYKHSLYEPIKQLEKGSKKINSLANYSARCIAFLFEDGTVEFVGELSIGYGYNERKVFMNQIKWDNIEKIDVYGDSVVGLKKDGTIIAVGKVEKFENEFRNWKNIVDIKIGCLGRYIIAKTSNGQHLIVGETPENYDAVSNWKDVIDVIDDGIPMGISRNGSLLWGSTKNKRVHADTARMFAQRGIVAVDSGIALKADGTIYTTDKTEYYSDWKNVVCVKHDINHNYAICANGSVLVREEKPEKAQEAREAERWKLFSHIDTLQGERQKAQANSYDSYYDDKKAEKKAKVKSASFWLYLGIFMLLASILFFSVGEPQMGTMGLLGGILGIVISLSMHINILGI